MTRNTKAQTNLNALKYLANSIIHEGQNPLSKIKTTCQVIKDNLEQTIDLIDSIYDSSTRSLLAMDIALQNVNFEEIDKSKFVDLSIAEVVGNAVEKYLFNNSKEIELLNINYDNDFVFKGDEVLMSFVILNLLKNSLENKARIRIWFDAKERRVYWCDERCGIDEKKLRDIFSEQKVGFAKPDWRESGAKLYEQKSPLQTTTSTALGAGLGLLFCKRVMKAFGGDISVKSEAGKGTEFCLRFE